MPPLRFATLRTAQRSVAVTRELDVRTGHARVRGRRRVAALPPAARRAEALQDVPFQIRVGVFRKVAGLETRLAVEQRLTQMGLIVPLGVSRHTDLVEDEAESVDQQRVENEHVPGPSNRAPLPTPARASSGC